MRRFFAAVCCFALLPVVASAQEQGWAAKFFPSGVNHDFGNVAHGAVLTHKFAIKNIYEVPFIVLDAKVSCGCVMPTKPVGEIPKNGTAELDIEMDTRRIPAGIRKEVSITVTMLSVAKNPGDKVFSSIAVLRVASFPQRDISCNPDRINFGTIAVGNALTSSINVSHRTNRQWTLDVVKNNLPFDVTIQRGPQVRGFASVYQVNVTLAKNAPVGDFKHELQLQTNDPAMRVLPITIQGTVQAPLTVTPSAIAFTSVKVNGAETRNVIVRGNGQPFKIKSIEGDGDGLNVKFSQDARAAHVVTIEYQPKQAGTSKKTLTIKADIGGEQTATVTVDATATP